jgi:uncharacterized membrane protein
MAGHSSKQRTRWRQQGAIVALSLIAAVALATPFTGQNMFGTYDTLDNSWQWSQYVAAHVHLQFGSQYLFTYGPWGFLDLPIQGGPRGMWILTIVVTIAAQVSLLVLMVSMLRRSPRLREASRTELAALGVAAAVTVIEVLAQSLFVLIGAIVLLLAADLMRTGRNRWGIGARIGWITALLALDSLVKISMIPYSFIVIVCVAGFLLTAVEFPLRARLWSAAATVVLYPVLFIGFWLAASQNLSGLPGFLSGTLQIITGYPRAESLSGYVYQVVILLLLAALVVVLVAIPALVRTFRGAGSVAYSARARPQVVWTIVMTGAVAFFWWKEGVVRQDPAFASNHFAYAVIGLALGALVLIAVIPRGTVPLGGAVATLTMTALSLFALSPGAIVTATHPGANATATSTGLGNALDASSYAHSNATAIAALRNTYQIPTVILRTIGSSPVTILPVNLTIGPAYGLHQVILPVPQMYQANTPQLDQLDASFLRTSRVPYVLLQYGSNGSNGSQYTVWSPPAVYNELLTDYTLVRYVDGVALFHRHPRPTTTRPSAVRSMVIGQWMAVPRCSTGSTFASFTLNLSLAGRLTEFAFRDPPVSVDLKVAGSTVGPFPFVWAVASEGLNVSGYVSSGAHLEPIGQPKSANPAITALRVNAPTGMFKTGQHGSVPVTLRCIVDS